MDNNDPYHIEFDNNIVNERPVVGQVYNLSGTVGKWLRKIVLKDIKGKVLKEVELDSTRFNIPLKFNSPSKHAHLHIEGLNRLNDVRVEKYYDFIILPSMASNKPKPTPARPSLNSPGQKLLYCPFGEFGPKMKTRKIEGGRLAPGAIIHHTAGRYDKGDASAIATQKYGITRGHGYWCISRDGSIFMSHPLNCTGVHSGSKHDDPDYGYLGIEITGAGKLKKRGDKFYTWYGEEVPENEVRYVKAFPVIRQEEGYYHKFSPEQEASLINLLCWMKYNDPEGFSFDRVLGHQEVSRYKNDPGGSLSVSVDVFRVLLQERYDELYG